MKALHLMLYVLLIFSLSKGAWASCKFAHKEFKNICIDKREKQSLEISPIYRSPTKGIQIQPIQIFVTGHTEHQVLTEISAAIDLFTNQEVSFTFLSFSIQFTSSKKAQQLPGVKHQLFDITNSDTYKVSKNLQRDPKTIAIFFHTAKSQYTTAFSYTEQMALHPKITNSVWLTQNIYSSDYSSKKGLTLAHELVHILSNDSYHDHQSSHSPHLLSPYRIRTTRISPHHLSAIKTSKFNLLR